MVNESLVNELRATLQKEHDILVDELKSIANRDPNVKGGWVTQYPQFEQSEFGSHSALEEEADEVEEYESRLGAEHSLESRLLEVNRALERINKGIFGACSKCRKPITEERLRANPAAEFHVECTV